MKHFPEHTGIPIQKIRVINYIDDVTGPMICIEFPLEDDGKIKANEKAALLKPTHPDGRMRNSNVAYSDNDCEIISNRMHNQMVLVKTLSDKGKWDFHNKMVDAIESGTEEKVLDPRLEHGIYSASDMFPLTHALQYLGFEVSDACARDLSAALVRSKKTKQIVEITPPVQGANLAAP
jgi:hypothetical protein